MSDLDVAVYDADILVFVVPYQYIHEVCDKLRGKVKSSAVAVSLVKVGNRLVTVTNNNSDNNTCLMTYFQDNLGKLVPEG